MAKRQRLNKKITVIGLEDDEQITLNLLVDKLNQHYRRNELRRLYYDMKHVTRLVGSVIPPNYWRIGIVLGWSGKAVDLLARRCNLENFVWPGHDLDSLGAQEIWEDNNLGSEVNQGLTSSLIHAVAFAVNTEGGEDEPDTLLHFRSAMDATGEWSSRLRRLTSFLSITGRGDDGSPVELALYLPNETIIASVHDDKRWHVDDRQVHPWGVPAEPLRYQPRLERPMGRSRISRAIMSLQDQATRSAIRLEAHSDIYAIPDLWMLGADMSIFKNPDGSPKSSFQVMMGRIKGIPDDPEADDPALSRVDVKQFAASDPDPHLKTFRQLAQIFSGESSIPLSSLGVSDMANPTSADSYIASREDLISEAEGATDEWSTALRRAFLRALAMKNDLDAIPEEWKTIQPRWRSPVYLSRAAQADAGSKQVAAAPWLNQTEVGLELLGLDDQQIERSLADKRLAEGRAALQSIAEQAGAGEEPPA